MDRILSVHGILCISAIIAVAKALLRSEHASLLTSLLPAFLQALAYGTVVYLIFWRLVFPFFLDALRFLPTPKGHSVWKPYTAALLAKPQGKPYLDWIETTPNNGIILLRSIFEKNRLLLTSPKALSDILVHHAYDFQKLEGGRDFLRRILGDGLVVVEGDAHRFQRKHLMPTFNFRSIKELYPMIWGKSLSLIGCISKELESLEGHEEVHGSRTIDVNTWASKVTLDIIGVAGLGRNFNALQNTEDELAVLYEDLLAPTVSQLIAFVLSTFAGTRVSSVLMRHENKKVERIGGQLREICRRFIAEKRQAKSAAGSTPQSDILSMLMDSNDFSDEDLVSQLLTFLAAGHETTASAFSWVAYLVATHPAIQAKLHAEVDDAFSDTSIYDPSLDIAGILEKLPYLNGICNEALRLYPTVPITFRVATANTKIVDQYVPKGTEVFMSMWAINRSRQLWGSDAESFVPERWISNGKPNNHGGASSNYSLLTFLHGPRSCIGQNFAKAELRCITAAFALAFAWELDMPVEDVIPAGSATIKPSKGLRVKLRKRPSTAGL